MRKIPKNSNSLFIVITLFTLLSLLLFWPIFLGKVNLNGSLLVSFFSIFGKNLPYKNIVGLDQLRLYYPNFSLVVESLKNFNLPHWNPYIFAGNLNIASLQSAVFYPLNVFGLVLPYVWFWHLLRISPMILGAFFTFLYLRSLNLSKYASFFGALSFGFSPFILTWGEEQVNIPHTVIWLPLILFCIDKVFNKSSASGKKILYLLLISISIASSVFAGFIQTTIYVIIFALFYSFLKINLKEFKSVRLGLVVYSFFLVGILISAVQLLPTAELYFNSARETVTLKDTLFKFLLPIESLLTYFAPDFYGNPTTWNFFRRGAATYYESILFVGIPVLLFAFYEIFENRKDRLTKFYSRSWIITLLLILSLPTAYVFLRLPIPFLSSSIANRLLIIPTFCLVVLAARGMDMWLFSKSRRVIRYILIFGAIYGLISFYLFGVKLFGFAYFNSGALTSLDTFKISLRNLVIPVSVFLATSAIIFLSFLKRFKSRKYYFSVLIIFLLYIHLFLFSQKYFSFTEKENVFPNIPVIDFIQRNQGYFRSWGLGDAYLENNFASQYKLYFAEGYNSLNILSYAEFTQLMQGGNLDDFIFRADAGLGRGKSQELLDNEGRRRLLDIVGVKYVIAKGDDFGLLEENNFVKVFESSENEKGNIFGVFGNLEVLPRAFLASNYEGPPQVSSTGKTDSEIQKERRKLIPQKLLAENFDFKNVLILESPSPISPQFGPGKAEIISYKPHEVIVKTESAQPKLLFLSDNYHPGWKAQVDGDQTPILRADYTFRAVPLIPGEHIVRFYFDSDIFKLGLLTTFASLGVLIYLISRRNPLLG